MRIDILLNKLCLTKTRSIAKQACDKNLVKLNTKPAKASSVVSDGDIISLKLYGFAHEIRIVKIPMGNVSKSSATDYYEMLSKTPLSPD